MTRLAAWVLFLLACVLPSWYLRDIVAAEGQTRLGTRFLLPAGWRRCNHCLGRSGQERLWEVLSQGSDKTRRENAYDFLFPYHGPLITERFVKALVSADPLMQNGAVKWVDHFTHWDDLCTYLRGISAEEFVGLLQTSPDNVVRVLLIGSLWFVRPEEAERAGTRWIRETTDPFAVRHLHIGPPRLDLDRSTIRRYMQSVHTILLAGKENPRRAVRETCAEMLEEVEKYDGIR